jgi:site-specific recombinase XerD
LRPFLSEQKSRFRSLSAEIGGYLRFRSLYQHSPAGSIDQYRRTYDSLLDHLPADRLDTFTGDRLEAWTTAELERGVSARTVASRLAHLVSLGDYLVRNKLLTVNPARGIERPRYKRRPTKFLFPEELKALMSAERPDHERVALALFIDTMLRVSELANARVGDLEHTEGDTFLRVVVKGGEEKRVPLSPEVAEQVEVYLTARGGLPRSAPLLVNSRGQKWTRSGLSQRVAQIAADAGITRFRVSAHKLRHTAASLALASGVNPLAVSKLLNHSNLKTTEQYLHLLPNALVDARAHQRAGLKRFLA